MRRTVIGARNLCRHILEVIDAREDLPDVEERIQRFVTLLKDCSSRISVLEPLNHRIRSDAKSVQHLLAIDIPTLDMLEEITHLLTPLLSRLRDWLFRNK